MVLGKFNDSKIQKFEDFKKDTVFFPGKILPLPNFESSNGLFNLLVLKREY
jgi:hypothetical protein